MKFKINIAGNLEIERVKGSFKQQICPYRSGYNCGDHCPLLSMIKHADTVTIFLCNNITATMDTKDFIDERI